MEIAVPLAGSLAHKLLPAPICLRGSFPGEVNVGPDAHGENIKNSLTF